MDYYREYIIAQITKDIAEAEKIWNKLSNNDRNTLNRLMLGLNNYSGIYVEAPIGSTWKAHKDLVDRVNKITNKYISDFTNAVLSNSDMTDFNF